MRDVLLYLGVQVVAYALDMGTFVFSNRLLALDPVPPRPLIFTGERMLVSATPAFPNVTPTAALGLIVTGINQTTDSRAILESMKMETAITAPVARQNVRNSSLLFDAVEFDLQKSRILAI